MKKIGLFLLAALFVFGLPLSAQNRIAEKNYEKRKEVRENRKEVVKEKITPKKRAGYMAVDMELNDAQRDKLQALFEKQDKQRKEHQAEMKKLREKQMSKMDAQRKANDAEMEKILGAEKFKELQDKRAESKARVEKNMARRAEFRNKARMGNDGRMERRVEKRIKIRKPDVQTPN